VWGYEQSVSGRLLENRGRVMSDSPSLEDFYTCCKLKVDVLDTY
jgi:hypothetical protein